jgi:hypothetical protein
MQMLIYNLRKLAKHTDDHVAKDILKNSAYFMVFCKGIIKMMDLALYERDISKVPCIDNENRGKCWAVNENVLGMLEEYLDELTKLGYITQEDRHPRTDTDG